MSPETRWRTYAACWSMSDEERSGVLLTVADPAVSYRDPATDLAGVDELATYMMSFRTTFPQEHFWIDDVRHHHDRSLAQWRQVSADRRTTMQGISIARHGDDGRFVDIAGFFHE